MNTSQVRALKLAVIGMGVLLVIGFGIIVGRIVYLLARPSASIAASRGPVHLELPHNAVIRGHAISGQRLSVHFETPEGPGFAILDLAGSEPPQIVRVTPKSSKP